MILALTDSPFLLEKPNIKLNTKIDITVYPHKFEYSVPIIKQPESTKQKKKAMS